MSLWMLVVWMLSGVMAAAVARGWLGGVRLWSGWGDRLLGCSGALVGGYSLALLDAGSWLGHLSSIAAALLGVACMIWLSNMARPAADRAGLISAQLHSAAHRSDDSDTAWSAVKSADGVWR